MFRANVIIPPGGPVDSLCGKVNNGEMKKFRDYAEDLIGFFKENGIDVGETPDIIIDMAETDPYDPFVPTGHYDFTENAVTLHARGRQCKDVLRTLAHELVHVSQYVRDPEGYASFDKTGSLEDNPELLRYEEEAYAKGNVMFRKWTEARNR